MTKEEYQKEYRIKNREKNLTYQKEYRIQNLDILKSNAKHRYNKNKLIDAEKLKEQNKINSRKYRKKNKEVISEKARLKRLINPEKTRQIEKKKNIYKSLNDPLFKIKESVRACIKNAFFRSPFTKKSKTYEILDCTFEEFKIYIESKFEPWMNWDNRGNWNGIPIECNVAWDIDHIIPISSAKTEEDVIKLNHYTNLQPLCSFYNRYIKQNKIL